MGILAVHEYLAGTLLPSVEILEDIQGFDDEVQRSIVQAFAFFPDMSKTLTQWPTVIQNHELQGVFFRSGFLEQHYAVHLQVFVHPVAAKQGLNAGVASALLQALILAVSGDLTLGGNVSVVRGIRGATPDTIVALTWAGVSFVGIELFVDVILKTTAEHRA